MLAGFFYGHKKNLRLAAQVLKSLCLANYFRIGRYVLDDDVVVDV